MNSYNKLTPKQTELLAGLNEELGEAIQELGKIGRHGLDSHRPSDPTATKNRDRLAFELADVFAMVDMCVDAGILNMDSLEQHKRARYEKFMLSAHHYHDIE